VLVLYMIEILPPLGKYKYDTWRILSVKCYIDNFVCLQSCIPIYRVGQITHRQITKNKWDQVIVTMHASKLKSNTRTKHIRTRTQSL
jgi:hypothetical protein